MANIKFYLKDASKNETSIYLRFNIGSVLDHTGKKVYQNFKYFITEKINPEYWDSKTCRAKKTKNFPQYPEFNARLNVIESKVSAIIYQIQNNEIEITPETLRFEIDKFMKPEKMVKPTETTNDLFSFIDHLIETSTNRESTLKSYKVVKRDLLNYQTEKKTRLTFEKIDIDFYNSFVEYLRKQNYATNTIGTRIKILKTFVSEANERGISVSEDYKKKSFKKPHEETHSIYLNESELMQIYRMEEQPDFLKRLKKKYNRETLPDYLDRIRDIFLIGCYTGLRFSDLSQLKGENINSDNTISVKTQKTNQNVVIPIHPIVKTILEKYDYQLPRIPSNQKFNDYIKEVAELAGINEKITTEITKGGLKVMETTEKFNHVTSHTARRSFATNAFLADVPSIAIMKITGHKTESAFMKYIKMSAKDNAKKMQMHPFFKMAVVK